MPKNDYTMTTTNTKKRADSLDTSTLAFGSSVPQLGRTQYFFGAVVLILNRIFSSVGLDRRMCDVMAWLNGPV